MSCTCQLIQAASLHSTVAAGYVVSFAPCNHSHVIIVLEHLTNSQLLIAIGIHVSLHIPILYHLGDCNEQWANGTRKPETTVHTYSQSYTHTVSRTHVQSYTHTVSRTHIQSVVHTYSQSYTRTVVHTYSRTQVQLYTHTVVHTYSRTHVQSYTHTMYACVFPLSTSNCTKPPPVLLLQHSTYCNLYSIPVCGWIKAILCMLW